MDRKIVEAKVNEVLSANIKKSVAAKKEPQQAGPTSGGMPNIGTDNLFAAFGGAGMPNLSAMAAMQSGKIPLKMHIMTKLASLAINPKYVHFLQKKWWPLWVIVSILFSGFILIGTVIFLIWKMLKSIFSSYTDLFKKS